MSRLKKLDRAVMELRGQLAALGIVLIGGLVLAIVIATQRELAESFVREKHKLAYGDFPARLQEAADALAAGELDPQQFAELSEEQRLLLYEDWIDRPAPPRPQVPAALTRLAPDLYLDCAEKTVVCGSAEQKTRAIRFLALCHSPAARERLERLRSWAQRRHLADLAEPIQQAISPRPS